MLQDEKETSCAVKPATLHGKEAFIEPSVVNVRMSCNQSRDLVLRSGRLDGTLVATSDCRRRVSGGLGVSKVGASRRLVLRVGTSVGLDGRILDVVTVRQGSKRSAAWHVAKGGLSPTLVLDRHTIVTVLAESIDGSCQKSRPGCHVRLELIVGGV